MKTTWAIVVSVGIAVSAAAQVPVTISGMDGRTDVAVTAYNNGLALVRDTRALTLPTGEVDVRFEGVPEQIRPETVRLASLADAGSLTVLEQNYEYDLISPQKLMEKYVSKEVRLVNFSNEVGFSEVTAKLLSNNQGPIYQVEGDIYLGHPGNVVLPEIPENLIAQPSLIWRLDNRLEKQRIEATYLTNGVNWRADYVLTLPQEAKTMDLAGWVTMDNQSGATYTNAKLKLVAGEVHTAPQRDMRRGRGMAKEMMVAAAPPMPKQESFAEYHLYTMPRRTTIKQNQSKQLALLSAGGVAFDKRYEFRGQTHFYHQQVAPIEGEHVAVFLDFENEEDNQLGMPLPGGVMRIYQEDSEGMLQFAGEDRIKHTPKDETVRLRMGDAFDVIGDRVQTDYKRLSNDLHESAFEITLRNHKEQGITVHVVQPLPHDWEIVEKSQDFEKKDAHTAIFRVPVDPDEEAKVSYRVRVKT